MTAGNGSSLAGYRIIRTLGRGRRATVHLGHGTSPDAGRRGVAIKVFARERAGAASAEIAILSAVRAPCIPALIDIASAADGSVCLVLERLHGPLLSQWLAGTRDPTTGELVTVIAPLVATLSSLHAARWALGDLTPGAVRLTAQGRPVVTSFAGAIRLDEPGAGPRAAAERVRADYAVLGRMVSACFDLAGLDDPGFAALLDTAAGAAVLADPLPDLEARLFAWAAPCPLVLDPDAVRGAVGRPSSDAMAGRAGFPAGGREAPFPAVSSAVETGDSAATGDGRVSIGARIAGLADLPWRSRALDGLRTVISRHRVATVAALGVATVIVGAVMLLLPSADGGDGADDGQQRAAESDVGPAPSAARAEEPSTTAAPDAAVSGDDPVAAALSLIVARETCLRRGSADCLHLVDEIGSPMTDADAAALRNGSDPPAIPVPSTITLVERVGDAAIVLVSDEAGAETPPAPLLLMKGEAGWRLREVFEG
ncbi:MAG: hypothetical protein ABWX82_13065 [Leifsonia sp.]